MKGGWYLWRRKQAADHIRPHSHRRFAVPPATIALLLLTVGFAVLIAIGTILLVAPFASTPDGSAPFLAALFTATSAACVTGLVVVDSGTYWTGFGQAVIAALMFLGGLGIMTAGTLLLLALGGRLTMTYRLVLRESMGASTMGNVSRLGRQVLYFAVVVQAIGFLLLFFRFLALFSPGDAMWQGLFHAISAFNNAGFVILPDSTSLSAFQRDGYVLAVISLLIVLGGISFAVVADLMRRQRVNRWALDTRLVLMGSLFLWLVGGVAFFAFEASNPGTMGDLPVVHQVSNSLFHVVSGRTAGFSTVDFGETRSATNFFYTVLMFIGGASASAAGGVKVNTVMVLLWRGGQRCGAAPILRCFGGSCLTCR
jgi:trk system potassium uptake protein TrkH